MKNIVKQIQQQNIKAANPFNYAPVSEFNDYNHSEDTKAFLLKSFKM